VVPFVNRRALGAVAGIVGAGGNVGAVAAGFLFKTSSISWPQALMILGLLVLASSSLAFLVRFSEREEASARAEVDSRLGVALVTSPAGAGD
jgi:NNP family nitrate/nitrite transporter-like MFS transporter